MDRNDIDIYQAKYLDNVLLLLRKQPNVFLSERSLTALCDFLTGYLITASVNCQVPMSFEHDFERDFHSYFMLSLGLKYQSKDVSYHSLARAMDNAASERGMTGFDLFYEEVFGFYPEVYQRLAD